MLRARLKLLFLDLGHHRFSSCEQEGPIKSISGKKMDFQAKLCSCSSPVCSGRGAGGPISLKHICSWMLMKGEHSLWRAFSRVLAAVCTSLWSWHNHSVPFSLQSCIFQEYTDEISIGSSVPALQRSQLACASHWSWSVCLCRSHVPKTLSQVNFQIQSGWLLDNGTSQQLCGDLEEQIHGATQLESVFPHEGSLLGSVCRQCLEMSQLKCQAVHLQWMYGLEKIPPKQLFSVLTKTLYFFLPPPPF